MFENHQPVVESETYTLKHTRLIISWKSLSVYVCLYVCIYVCMYVCLRCLSMYVCLQTCMYVCMCVCVYVCIDIDVDSEPFCKKCPTILATRLAPGLARSA